MARYRVTVDTGGTFSDFVYLNEETGELSIAKLPSTPDDPSCAILAGIDALLATAGEAADIGYFCHGTTVGTNALLEGKGVRTGLLVTEGFRGIYPVRELAAQNVESIAVCLLFSFLHPEHEARVREIIAQEMPDCSISLSSEVLPQIREYYRLSTTVINAYLQPILARYIAQLDRRLCGDGIASRRKYVRQMSGGMATFTAAA